jgi:hypothetical protein
MAETHAASGTRRIAFATKDARGFVSLRGSMLAEATRRRHTVLCLAPAFEAPIAAALQRMGVHAQAVAFEAQGFNPFAGYRIRKDMAGHLAAFGPHTLAITDFELLPMMVSAAERAGVGHIVPMVAHVPATLDKVQRKLFEAATAMIVETPDVARIVTSSRMLKPGVPVIVLPASGIDLKRAVMVPLPPIGEGLTFLHVTAASDRKAQENFAAAAADVKPRSGLARFVEADIDDLAAIAAAHVIVHAGDQDGLAAGLLAGLAAGRPLITSDVAGARDAVDERVNGCRFAPGDVGALARAMLSFLRRPDEITAMARASRAKAERRFDVDVVNRATLQALGLGESFAAAA